MIFNLFGKRKPAAPQSSSRDILAEIEARTGAATRAKELPAWALLMRSPYKTYPEATSWLGGAPTVPAGFDWPTGNDGRPLHFIAQIDLAALKPEPSTGARAPGLPAEGALLAFIGAGGHALRVIPRRDMVHAAAATPPTGLAAVSETGFWCQAPTFGRWPVDPVAYVDRGQKRPDFLPDPFATPQRWITTWGLAELEASLTHDTLATELRLGREFMDSLRSNPAVNSAVSSKPHVRQRMAHCALMEDHAPKLISALQNWQAMAAARPAEDAVDIHALTAIFTERTRLATAMENNYGARTALVGDAHVVWKKILSNAKGGRGGFDFSAIAPCYGPFVEARVTDWRGHRLFGLEPPFPNNEEDLRRQTPLISIAGDELIGTELENHYGFSVWLEDIDIARDRHTGGQLIWHCAV